MPTTLNLRKTIAAATDKYSLLVTLLVPLVCALHESGGSLRCR